MHSKYPQILKLIQVRTILIGLFLCLWATTGLQAQIKAQHTNPANTKNKVAIERLTEDSKALNVDHVVTAQHTSRTSGIHHMYLRQAVNGIEIIGTESSIHKTSNGTIVKVHNEFVKDIDATVRSASPGISASAAISGVARQMGYTISNLQELERKGGVSQEALFNKAGISVSDIPVKLAYFYEEGIGTTLVWQLSVEEINSADWWEFLVNASTGAIISQLNYTVSCFTEGHNHEHDLEDNNSIELDSEEKPVYTVANNPAAMVGSYNVIAMPDESPQHGSLGRQVVVDPDNAVASPFGWHDTNGVAGAESNYTIGNNTDAYDDRTSTVTGTGSGTNSERAFGGAGLAFSDPFNTDVTAGGTNGSIFAAVTNLFYWANIIHDVTYQYGFDEAAGNFQVNNYGNGGVGNDSVRSEAQDGSGTCNANFSTPVDGGRGRMQMYVCGTRDGDFDNGVIAHEYGHGISNRLTGGAGNAGCLNRFTTPEQMGEGWSDFYGLLLTMEVGDTRNDSRGIGTWLVGQGANGAGIRPTPYSTDFGVNSTTYNALPSSVVPHGVGYVWATMLWELTWDLIDDQGFDTDFYNGTGGNNIALNLVTEGMKLQPCSPGFVDGRDGILAADAALYGGAYSCLIWEAFARRGLGFSASQGSSTSIADGTAAFDLPPGLGSPSLDTVNSLCITSGTQNGLGGGTPSGGVYSGIGVSDDGNGSTFTFDPTVNGVGSVVVSYTLTNICTSTSEVDTDTIVIGNNALALICPSDITTCYADINYDFPRPSDGCFGRSNNRLSQNNDETINNGIDCPGDTSGHVRRFNLTTEGVVRDYLVTGIDVGINATTGANIIVNIYLDNTIDNAITTYRVPISDVVTPYATVTSAVPSGSDFVHTVPFDVFLPAGTAFTVEVISPSSQDFMIGYNDSGVNNNPNSTATAYTSCLGSLDYSDLVAFDLAENAVLIQVQGTESDSLTTTQTAGITTGETYPLGTTTNTFETTDGTNTVSCSFDVNVLGNTLTTFTGGAWNNGAPTTTAVAVFEEAYDTSAGGNSSIDACACEINNGGDLIVAAGDYLNVQTDVIVNSGGNLTVEHTGSVVQTNNAGVAINDGTMDVLQSTPNLASRDFMILGSPMTGETRTSVWGAAFLVLDATTANFVPHPQVAIDFPGAENFADDNNNYWQFYNGAQPINPGEGYLVRPQAGYGQPGGIFNYTYDDGTLNTGNIDFAVGYNTPGPTSADNKNASPNALANPYPSAISATDFINGNPMINEVYFWEHLTPPSPLLPGAGSMNFSMEDISMRNLGGGVGAGNPEVIATRPNDFIAAGQGFGIKASAGGTATFTNAMRRTTNNNTLRNPDPKDRLWLNVENLDYEMGGVTLIGFNQNATAGIDNGYDSRRIATLVSIYSHLEDGSEELGIQTREPFERGAEVPIGFSSMLEETLEYKISISTIEGENLSNATVYLIDHFANTVTNLSETGYAFTSVKGTFHNRFTLQFEGEVVLSNNDNVLDAVSIFPNPTHGMLSIISPLDPIKSISLVDVRGRVLDMIHVNDEGNYTMDISALETAVYFVKITTETGTTTKRIVKK